MACFHPITLYRSRGGRNLETGKWSLMTDSVKGYRDLPVQVPCGQCVGCRLARSREWAVRCIHEAQMHNDNCFLTLTFDDEHLDKNVSLNKHDYVNFMKRLRKHLDFPVRFFHCGEYGSLNFRPHHHAIIFGYDFPDKVLWQTKGGVRLCRSDLLEKLWPFGFCTIGDVTFDSAAYVARYIMKKVTGDGAEEYYQGRVPEYITMSRRPGVASDWIKRYFDDVYPHDYVVIKNSIKCRPPRYYDEIYDDFISDKYVSLKSIKDERKRRAREHEYDNSRMRLETREKVLNLKLKRYKREL
jgi:hypothetical protein